MDEDVCSTVLCNTENPETILMSINRALAKQMCFTYKMDYYAVF